MGGVSRFDCYPSDFLNGIVGLTADQIATYTVIMMLLYDRGKPVVYAGRERELQVRAGLSRSRLDKAIAHLADVGKVSITDGCLTNQRTEQELEKICERIEKNRENSEKGGKANKKNWDGKHNKINVATEPVGYPNGYPKDSPIPSPSSPVPQNPISSDIGLAALPPRKAKRKSPETEIAEDEQPVETDLEFARNAGMDSRQVREEWAQFRDHHRKKRNTMADWRAAWRTWVRNENKFRSRGGPARDGGIMGAIKNFLGDDDENDDGRGRKESTCQAVLGVPVTRNGG